MSDKEWLALMQKQMESQQAQIEQQNYSSVQLIQAFTEALQKLAPPAKYTKDVSFNR